MNPFKATKEIMKSAKDVNTFNLSDGSTVKIKGGIKKRGKILKIQVAWDKDFIEDDVNLSMKLGAGNITLVSPSKSSNLSVVVQATKRF